MTEKNEQLEAGLASDLNRELEALRKRHGIFVISMPLLNSSSPAVLKIMGKCFIYRAEAHYLKGHMEYTARSECFDELQEGEFMPEYVWVVDENGDVSAKRRSI